MIASMQLMRKLSVFIVALGLTACVAQPPERPIARPVAVAPRIPETQIIFYPAKGQSPQQQDRDRYDCYRWAVQQTGFDPSQLSLAPHQRIDVVPAQPPGQGALSGAATGAIIGAIASNPRHAGGGAVVGAIAGALIGAAADADRQQQADRLQQHYDQLDAGQQALLDEQAARYRRAMTACIEGRGYTVSQSPDDRSNGNTP